MAVVITVAQQKGGAGKSTLLANLAALLAIDRSVAIVDIDPQRTLSRWHALRAARRNAPGITLSDVSGWRLGGELDRLRGRHDMVLIDSPPRIDTDARLAVRAADLVLVPVQPSPPDLWAAAGTLDLARAERRVARIVLNRAPAGGRLREAVEAEIRRQAYLALDAVLGNRIGFAGAFAQGAGVTETAPRSIAAVELRALRDELTPLFSRNGQGAA
jgi:chromosome partitioning protein